MMPSWSPWEGGRSESDKKRAQTMPPSSEPEPEKGAVGIEMPKDDEKGDAKKADEKKKEDPDELSPEDKALLEGLELAVERVKDPDAGVQKVRTRWARTQDTSAHQHLPQPHFGRRVVACQIHDEPVPCLFRRLPSDTRCIRSARPVRRWRSRI